MKNLILALCTILFSGNAFSESRVIENTTSINLIQNENHLLLTINLGDITNVQDELLKEEINAIVEKAFASVDDELECEVKVTGQVNVGVASLSIEVSVKGPCSEIKQNGSQIAQMVLDQVKAAIKHKL